MRIGIFLNQYAHGPDRQVARDLVEQAELLDELGFDLLALGERHLYPDGFLDQAATLAYLAGRTTRIGLCSAGFILPLLDTVYLAEYGASLDALSGGRLILGVVAGYREDEFKLFGARLADRARRLDERLPILRGLLAGNRVVLDAVEGHLEAFVSPVPTRRPGIPIWVGARADAAIDRAAALADGWITSFNETPTELEGKIARYRAAAQRAGTRGEVVVCRDAFVHESAAAARATIEGPLLGLMGSYAGWKAGSPDEPRYRDVRFEDVAGRLVLGTPQEAIREIRRYELLGADRLILRCQFPGLTHDDTMRCLRLIGEAVLPALRATG